MKILIPITHPADFHSFKNVVRVLEARGYEFMFFVRDRECIVELVESQGYNYVCYGKGGNSFLSKLFQIPIIDWRLLKVAKKFKPDLFLSFLSPYGAHVSWLIKKTHIALDDTEHARLQQMMYRPFTDVILSPYVYNIKLHKRQLLFQSFKELLYLHKNYFKADDSIFAQLGIERDEQYVVVRFVSWNAYHDMGVCALSFDDKLRIINELSSRGRVFISSEGDLPKELEKYRLPIHPSQLHSVLYYATLCVSEGATTASEAAILGTPTIYINPLRVSYCVEEEKNGLLWQIINIDVVIRKITEILNNPNAKIEHKNRLDNLTSQMIDGTQLLVWFIENYPESKKIMKENPDYQNRFK